MSVFTVNGLSLADGNSVVFDNLFSNSVDNDDVSKQSNFGENFGILRNGYTLAIEARKKVLVYDTVYYRLWNLKAGTYQLEFTPRYFNTSGLTAMLHDNYLNSDSVISITDTTTFNFVVTTVAGSFAQDRFKLLLRVVTLPLIFTSSSAVEVPNGVQVNWKMAGSNELFKFEIEHARDGYNFNKIGDIKSGAETIRESGYYWIHNSPVQGANYYRVKAIAQSGKVTYSSVMKVALSKKASFAILQNPVQGKDAQLVFTSQVAGRYAVSIFSQTGQLTHASIVDHRGGSGNYSLNVSSIPSGSYQIRLITPNGEQITKPLLIATR